MVFHSGESRSGEFSKGIEGGSEIYSNGVKIRLWWVDVRVGDSEFEIPDWCLVMGD